MKVFLIPKSVKAMSLHMLNFHGIQDTFYKEDKHKHEILRLLNDNKLKSTYTIEDNLKFKCKLCPYESLEQSQKECFYLMILIRLLSSLSVKKLSKARVQRASLRTKVQNRASS